MNHNGHHLILKQFYLSNEWSETRTKFLRRCKEQNRPFVCKFCNAELCFASDSESNKIGKKSLNVDHILPVKYYWDKRLDLDNLQLLCSDCNKLKANQINENDIKNSIEAAEIEKTILTENSSLLKEETNKVKITYPNKKRYHDLKILMKPKSVIQSQNVQVSTVVEKNGKSQRIFRLPKK